VHTITAIRVWIAIFIAVLVGVGVSVFPLVWELQVGSVILHQLGVQRILPGLVQWIDRVHRGVDATNSRYPWIFYGTDWLAYAHLMIAVAFIGPLRNPVRNIWVVQFGMIACVSIIPLAAIAGPIRGIPLGWEFVDMSFGVIGIIPLIIVYRLTRRLERELPGSAHISV
jgi:hypothetical protein